MFWNCLLKSFPRRQYSCGKQTFQSIFWVQNYAIESSPSVFAPTLVHRVSVMSRSVPTDVQETAPSKCAEVSATSTSSTPMPTRQRLMTLDVEPLHRTRTTKSGSLTWAIATFQQLVHLLRPPLLVFLVSTFCSNVPFFMSRQILVLIPEIWLKHLYVHRCRIFWYEKFCVLCFEICTPSLLSSGVQISNKTCTEPFTQ